MRFAGIAGGVGTTVTAQIMGGTDAGRSVCAADVVVARNDYRSAKALKDANLPADAVVLVIEEEGRALSLRDIAAIVPNKVVGIPYDQSIARADDAGLIDAGSDRIRKYRDRLSRQIATNWLNV